MSRARKPYPSDVSDDEWSLVAPYLALVREDALQRHHPLRELFNGLRYVIRYGIAWRAMPNDLPPWSAVYQQAQRWMAAGCFEALVDDLRAVLRLAAGRAPEPSAAIFDSRTLRSSPESGTRAGYDGAKRKRGSKLHMAVDTLGHLLALHVTPASTDDRAEVGPSPKPCRRQLETASIWRLSTRDTPARSPLQRPRLKGPSSRSSSCPRPSVASSSCPADGSWNALSRGPRAAEGW